MQTLSRLNRCTVFKNDTCILDFVNNPCEIKESFERYYKITNLFGETNPNRLNELIYAMESAKVFSNADVEEVVALYLNTEDLDALYSKINQCVENYTALDIDAQINFKRNVKIFIRTYSFLAAIMPCNSAALEKLFIFLTLLLTKLPAPKSL